tara:strand:- start:1791 stop:2015 length:225 start_codon:yes stop_codon:yes gene_type:complete
MISTLRKEIAKWRNNIMAKETKPKYYDDMTKQEMVNIIIEQKGMKLPALVRATKEDIEELAKALNVSANYKGAK